MTTTPLSTLDAAESAADGATSTSPVGSVVAPCPLRQAWIEIQLLGDDDTPIADQRYRIVAPGGAVFTGKTDAAGVARVEGLHQGDCEVTLPDLDAASWDAAKGTGG